MSDDNKQESSQAAEMEKADAGADVAAPIILSLGKQKKKNIKRLKRGKGKLMDDIADVVEQVHDQLGTDTENKILVPIVVIYREKQKRIRGLF